MIITKSRCGTLTDVHQKKAPHRGAFTLSLFSLFNDGRFHTFIVLSRLTLGANSLFRIGVQRVGGARLRYPWSLDIGGGLVLRSVLIRDHTRASDHWGKHRGQQKSHDVA